MITVIHKPPPNDDQLECSQSRKKKTTRLDSDSVSLVQSTSAAISVSLVFSCRFCSRRFATQIKWIRLNFKNNQTETSFTMQIFLNRNEDRSV